MMLFALAAALAVPQPGKLQTFKDWIVGCDNTLRCDAVALTTDGGDADTLMVDITREAGPGSVAVLVVPLPDKTAAGERFTLSIDAKVRARIVATREPVVNVPLTRALIDALSTGAKIALVDANGASVGEASLAGLAASFLSMDDRQHRVGTTGALKAPGAKPDVAVAPPAPVIVIPARSSRPPRTIGAALAAKLIGPDAATCEYSHGEVAPRASRLDAGHSVVVIDHPCGNGAYNVFSSVFILDETGPPRPAQFDVDPGMGEQGDTDLTNGDWDPKTQRIDSYAKGRGIGDCGTSQSYAWDGARFRMVEMTEMGECRGSVDWIRTWTARTRG